jgi:hypothetical protein
MRSAAPKSETGSQSGPAIATAGGGSIATTSIDSAVIKKGASVMARGALALMKPEVSMAMMAA